MSDSLSSKFLKLGLTPEKAIETAQNKKLGPILDQCILSLELKDPKIGSLLYYLASTVTKNAQINHLSKLSQAIYDLKLTSTDQISGILLLLYNNKIAAIKYAENTLEFNQQAFENAAGVGVVISQQEIKDFITDLFKSRHDEIIEKRYSILGSLLGACKQSLKWANAQWIKEELDAQLLSLLGPKGDLDDPKKVYLYAFLKKFKEKSFKTRKRSHDNNDCS